MFKRLLSATMASFYEQSSAKVDKLRGAFDGLQKAFTVHIYIFVKEKKPKPDRTFVLNIN